MAENDLKVIQKAKELATHTLKVTSNANRYPKTKRDIWHMAMMDKKCITVLHGCRCRNHIKEND